VKQNSKIVIVILAVLLASCAPVLRKDYMEAGIRDIPLSKLKQDPEQFKGRLFILGGIIVNTKLTNKGSLIEAIHVKVDSRGYLEGGTDGRFLALYPKEAGMLDPQIYHKGRRVTLAAEFAGERTGKIDETKYVFPLFIIKDYHLWEERRYYYPGPSYYYPYPYFYWWDSPILTDGLTGDILPTCGGSSQLSRLLGEETVP
jgi:outer membrane lipoprotein